MINKRCTLHIEKHASDRCIERGISENEIKEGFTKGSIRKSYVVGNNKSKHFVKFKYFEIVCVCIPCNNFVKTVYIK